MSLPTSTRNSPPAWYAAFYRLSSVALLAVSVAACDAADRVTATPVALAAAKTPASRVDAFLAAQGTYCNDAIGLLCAPTVTYGIGYLYGICTVNCGTDMVVDFAGINRRWWDARNLGAYPAAYTSTGTISETVQSDGRRRLLINIRARNTFVVFYTATLGPLVGADFFEYPTNGTPSYRPLLGEATIHAEMILPAGYLGYPDIVEVLANPASGIELRSLNGTATVEGPLRAAYNGLAAGTMVRVHGVSRSLFKLQARAVPSRHLIARDYDPTSRIEVHALR